MTLLVNPETGEVVSPLTDEEMATLDDCQAVIERGLATFVEVGDALATVRDERLYRSGYGTFEHYCEERWGLKRAQAYRLIEGAEVVAAIEAVSPIGDKPTPLPATESPPVGAPLAHHYVRSNTYEHTRPRPRKGHPQERRTLIPG